MSADVVILVPMLGRANLVERLLDSVEVGTNAPYRVLFIANPSDTRVHDAVRAHTDDLLIIDRERECGDYARKINAGVNASTEPLIFTGAIDLLFHEGWLEAARHKLTHGIGVVGTNDMGSRRVMRGEHSTHSLVTRPYAERGLIDGEPGLMFEGYEHEYVDDELVGTARRRRAFAMALDSRVEHLHPAWGKAPSDELYDAQHERMSASFTLFRRRKRLWR